jgi:MtN3 and saliva related transmembrane protein
VAGKGYRVSRWLILGLAIILGLSLPLAASPPVPQTYNTPPWIEAIGILAGVGTTFASLPDCLEMLKQRSTLGTKPRMAAITGVFQVLWLVYGLLIYAPAVIFWNAISILINATTVAVFIYFLRREKRQAWGDRRL